jgi:hypothetical protein
VPRLQSWDKYFPGIIFTYTRNNYRLRVSQPLTLIATENPYTQEHCIGKSQRNTTIRVWFTQIRDNFALIQMSLAQKFQKQSHNYNLKM